jgi:hypothetical protein
MRRGLAPSYLLPSLYVIIVRQIRERAPVIPLDEAYDSGTENPATTASSTCLRPRTSPPTETLPPEYPSTKKEFVLKKRERERDVH